MKYAVITFGCRVNQADSLAVEGELRAQGAECASPEAADVVVINTCSVTAAADQGARQMVRRVARGNPRARIVVTGCYATRRPDEVASLPNVLRVVPNPRKDRLVADLVPHRVVTTADRYAGADGPCGSTLAPGAAGRTAFTLRVQTGCDQRCSYCIIPRTRGAGLSRPLDVVCRGVADAVQAGYREIAITGVHLGSYGRDLGDGTSLVALVRRLAAWEADVLFRISSLEPMDCGDDLVDLVAASRRLAPHLHLPLQHGSDAMLARMRRPYTASAYATMVERIHRLMPHASIGTDLIVGFPGETDAEADETARVVSALPLSHLHVFPYSHREGTEASGLNGLPDGAAVRARAQRLREIGAALTARFKASQIGAVRRALVVDDGQAVVTDNYLKLRLDTREPRNTWVRVRVGEQGRGVVLPPAPPAAESA